MKIKGIKFSIHYSWYIVAVFLTYGLWRSYFPSVSYGKSPFSYLLMGLVATIVLFGCVVMHELAHSFVAWIRGIKTESITLYFFGGVAELKREADGAESDLYISLAGPVMSFILAFSFKVLSVSPIDEYLYSMNLMIGAFNLLPAFPLDGGRALRAVFWKLRKKGFIDAMRCTLLPLHFHLRSGNDTYEVEVKY
ncbi:MAG: site-2 protease family protein [Thermodesulfovibrionales bacterium]